MRFFTVKSGGTYSYQCFSCPICVHHDHAVSKSGNSSCITDMSKDTTPLIERHKATEVLSASFRYGVPALHNKDARCALVPSGQTQQVVWRKTLIIGCINMYLECLQLLNNFARNSITSTLKPTNSGKNTLWAASSLQQCSGHMNTCTHSQCITLLKYNHDVSHRRHICNCPHTSTKTSRTVEFVSSIPPYQTSRISNGF
jgi:hypothetical protein